MTRVILEAALVATVTAFSVGDGNTPHHGVTASGARVEAGDTLAADWDYHPAGTRVWLDGVGWRTVTDRGSGIKGPARFDLYLPLRADAIAWGRRRVAVQVVAPVISPTLYRNGQPVCHAAPMGDGAYSARHCLEDHTRDVYTMPGTARLRWSVDPTRDLAHFVGGDSLPGAPMRESEPGEYARISQDTKEVRLRRANRARNLEGPAWCVTAGRVRKGDSGSGLWAESDGALVGVLIQASQLWSTRVPEETPECGRVQLVVSVSVP